jgi:carboxymethylenebutenolidase
MAAITLQAPDGFALSAWHEPARDARRGGLLLVQEIFGVNANIRGIAARFAEVGFEVLAPSFFDRIEPGFDAPYDADGIARGREAVVASPWEQVLGDAQAGADWLAASASGPIHVAGFCWGGTVAWLAACRLTGLASAASFYGRQMFAFQGEVPRVPTECHFGREDTTIPMSDVEGLIASKPDLPVWVYDAGHGFFSDRGHDFRPDASDLAFTRTLRLFHRASGARGEH